MGVRPRWTAAGDSCHADVSATRGVQRLWRISSLSASSGSTAALAAQRRPHGEEVGRRGDVVDAQDVRAGVDAVADRGERARAALARRRGRSARRRSPCARPPAAAGARARAAPRRRRSSSIVCAGVLAKSGPGSRISCSSRTPRARASVDPLARGSATTSADDVLVEPGILQALLGRRARVHEHERRAGARADVGERGIAQPADVVDDHGARGDRRRRRPPACTCRPRRSRRARRRAARRAARRARSPPRPRPAGAA